MMEREVPKSESMTASDVRQHFAETINRVAKVEKRVIVEKNGVPVAAIVPFKDVRRLERLDAEDQEIRDVLEAMQAPFRDVPWEELEREGLKAVEAVRAERRARQKRPLAGTGE
jgi:prevent-host-death family protein